MHLIDWLLLLIPVLVVIGFSIYSQKYVRSVADFLAAGRTGGRYLLTSANGMAGMGLITMVAAMQKFRHAGWAISWWDQGILMVLAILGMSGFVFYRYRETRVLTLAQFFEVRYDRKFRIVMGTICWLSGVINFGIFPAINARFFIILLGLPEYFGPVPTFPALMLLLLGLASAITMSGGQIQNMVTDTIQALFAYTMCVIVGIGVLCLFTMTEFKATMLSQPPGKSFINPFDALDVADFNIYFFLINLVLMVYTYGAWQGNQGYCASAINPHEAKMGNILSSWRMITINLFGTVISLGALTFLTHPDFAGQAQALIAGLNTALPAAEADQMAMPIGLATILPIGIKGIFAAVMFFFLLSTDTTYIHSWGSILVQDIVLPVYGKPVSRKIHMLLLRLSLLFVALFAFFFSYLYQQSEYINMFQILTGALFSSGAGCAIIGGLYWKRGTRQGAWAGMAAGSAFALCSIAAMDVRGWQFLRSVLLRFQPGNAVLLEAADRCPVNGAWLSLIAALLAITCYVSVSLLTCRKPFNMDKLLYRGKYAIKEEAALRTDSSSGIRWYQRLFLGFDEEFTRRDRWVSISVFCWIAFWGVAFLLITAWNLIGVCWPDGPIRAWSGDMWFNWFIFYVVLHVLLAPVTAVWMTWGGIRDMKEMYRRLRLPGQSADDGFVAESETRQQSSKE